MHDYKGKLLSVKCLIILVACTINAIHPSSSSNEPQKIYGINKIISFYKPKGDVSSKITIDGKQNSTHRENTDSMQIRGILPDQSFEELFQKFTFKDIELSIFKNNIKSTVFRLFKNQAFIGKKMFPIVESLSMLTMGGLAEVDDYNDTFKYYPKLTHLLFHGDEKPNLTQSAFIKSQKEYGLPKGQTITEIKAHLQSTECKKPTIIVNIMAWLNYCFGTDWISKLPIKRIPLKPTIFYGLIHLSDAFQYKDLNTQEVELWEKETNDHNDKTCCMQ